MSEVRSPPHDRYCDLVMKGGITSGIVYPGAIGALSRHYRFKSIGGTSAGAIAAVLAAAAEYRRRQTGSHAGFDLLERLPNELGKRGRWTRKSKLLSLFQPQPGTRRLFRVLTTALNSKGTLRRVFWITYGFLFAYWPAVVLAAAAGSLTLIFGAGWFAAVLCFIFVLLWSIAAWVYFDITRRVVENNFGLCNGMTEDKKHEALTPWLHRLIQEAAGKPLDEPLTFGDLWRAEGFPPDWLNVPEDKKRSIDLQMFSTNLAHGRPYVFPMPEPDTEPSRFRSRERLYFKPQTLAPYLPADVLKWMKKNARPYVLEPDRQGKDPEESAAGGALELPKPRDFPVLLAARMSLSFPFLFSAVPLYSIDHDALRGERQFRCCWFSDGGISSNFPMHLFDGLVPLWPTFGITLRERRWCVSSAGAGLVEQRRVYRCLGGRSGLAVAHWCSSR